MCTLYVSDRQDIEKEVMQLRKENVVLEASLDSKINENDEINKEVLVTWKLQMRYRVARIRKWLQIQ